MKKALALLLACTMILSLVGCNTYTSGDEGQHPRLRPVWHLDKRVEVDDRHEVPKEQQVVEEYHLQE